MTEARNRSDNPAPGIEYQEIYLPDDSDFGTGKFTFRVKENSLEPPCKSEPKAISAVAFNPPRFQLSVSLSPGTKEVPVLLGHADGSDPLSKKLFLLPASVDTAAVHDFEVFFGNWQIKSCSMDGVQLKYKD